MLCCDVNAHVASLSLSAPRPQIGHYRAPSRALFVYTEHRANFVAALKLVNQKQGML